MGVGHERAPNGRRQAQRVLHLVERARLGVAAPRLERRRRGALLERHGTRRARVDQLLGDPGEVGVVRVGIRLGHHAPKLRQSPVPPQPLDRLRQRVQRHAEQRPGLEADRNQVVSADTRHSGAYYPGTARVRAS